MFEALKSIWEILNSPDNDPIIVGFLIALVGLFVAHLRGIFNCRARLKDKEERILDLVEQRNKFQDKVLGNKGIKRRSSKE